MPEPYSPSLESSPIDRFRSILAVIIAGIILLVVTQRVLMIPVDPTACVSVLTCRLGWFLIPLCAVLAFVLAALISIASGSRRQELGVFGVALGFSVAATRFGNAGFLWTNLGLASDPDRRALALMLALEALGWLIVLFAAALGSYLTCSARRRGPFFGDDPATEYRRGTLATIFVAAVALLLLQVFSVGTDLAPIRTGQVYFACAISCYLAALIAYSLTSASTPLWIYLAVGLVVLVGSVWSIFDATPDHPGRSIAHLAHLPSTVFGRPLPIQLVMVSAAGAIFGYWHHQQFVHYAAAHDHHAPRQSAIDD